METRDVVIGIDIGGTKTAFGFVDRQGGLLAEASIATEASQPAHQLVARIHDKIGEVRAALESKIRFVGIGIGAPNANYYRGTVEKPVNLNWGASTNLVELFQQQYDLPVAVTNDANAAAVGELLFGAATGMRHFIVITLGTGLGSGLVINGELLYGHDGYAGELGHTVVDPRGRHCACGKQGCLETYVSAGGICRTVFSLLAERREASPLRAVSFQELTSKTVFDAARTGDPIALAAFDETARLLGMKLADAVAHTSPEAIFLCGGLAEAGDLLLKPTLVYMDGFLLHTFRGRVKLLPSGMASGAGAILGVAALIWHQLDRPVSGAGFQPDAVSV